MKFKKIDELPDRAKKSSKWEPMIQDFIKSGYKYAEIETGDIDPYELGKINSQISICSNPQGVKCRRINNHLYLVREELK